jgi:DNA-directed RNA polymerase specialized sigma24 family protein
MRGHPGAAEVADSFFGYLFEQRLLPRIDRDQGRFRCYMQGVIRLYVRNWKRRTARTASDIEDLDLPAGDDGAIERDEESWWASTVLANAIARFKNDNPEYAELLLRRYGIAPFAPETPEELAARTGRSKGAINVAVHRGRERLKDAVLEEIRELSGSTSDFETESELLIQRILDAHPTLLALAGNANA